MLRAAQKAVQQTVYLATKDNTLYRMLAVIGLGVDFLSMLGLLLHAGADWPVGDAFSAVVRVGSLDSTLLPWAALVAVLCIVIVTISVMILLGVVLGFQVFRSGGVVANLAALRVLRVLAGLTVTVLFLPILRLLFSTLPCSATGFYEGAGITCYGWEQILIVVSSATAVLAFILFAGTVAALVFEPEPTSTYPLARATNRLELFYQAGRIALALVSLTESMVAVTLVFTAVTGPAAFVAITRPPFYQRRTNMLRSGTFTALFFAGFWAAVYALVPPLRTDTAATIWFVLFWFCLIFGAFFGALASFWRFNTIAYAAIGGVDVPIDAPPSDDVPECVRETETAKSRFKSIGSLVERRTRFLQTHQGDAYVRLANTMYLNALENNPTSASLHANYAMFLLTYGDENGVVTGAVSGARNTMDQVGQLKMLPDTRFLIFRMQSSLMERAQSSQYKGSAMSALSHASLRKHQQEASQHSKSGRKWIERFWVALALGHTSEMVLIRIAERIMHHEDRATRAFDFLLTNFPNSVPVIRAYASFLTDIVGDDEGAMLAVMHADTLEERNAGTRAPGDIPKSRSVESELATPTNVSAQISIPGAVPELKSGMPRYDSKLSTASSPSMRRSVNETMSFSGVTSSSGDSFFGSIESTQQNAKVHMPATRRVRRAIHVLFVVLIAFTIVFYTISNSGFQDVRDTLEVDERITRARALQKFVLDVRLLDLVRQGEDITIQGGDEDSLEGEYASQGSSVDDGSLAVSNTTGTSNAVGDDADTGDGEDDFSRASLVASIGREFERFTSVAGHLRDIEQTFYNKHKDSGDLDPVDFPMYVYKDGDKIVREESIWQDHGRGCAPLARLCRGLGLYRRALLQLCHRQRPARLDRRRHCAPGRDARPPHGYASRVLCLLHPHHRGRSPPRHGLRCRRLAARAPRDAPDRPRRAHAGRQGAHALGVHLARCRTAADGRGRGCRGAARA